MSENSLYESYPNVDEKEDLWRGIHESFVRKDANGKIRPSSAAFKDGRRELSVDIASKTTPKKSIAGRAALVSFAASIPKQYGHSIKHVPSEDNPAHALVLGKMGNPCIRKIISTFRWVIKPKTVGHN